MKIIAGTPTLLLCMAAFMCENFTTMVLFTWMPMLLYNKFHLSLAMAGLTATLYEQSTSMLGSSIGGWTQFARKIQDAGADALELNIYYIPTSTELTGGDVEKLYCDLVSTVKSSLHIPVAVKISVWPRLSQASEVQVLIEASS